MSLLHDCRNQSDPWSLRANPLRRVGLKFWLLPSLPPALRFRRWAIAAQAFQKGHIRGAVSDDEARRAQLNNGCGSREATRAGAFPHWQTPKRKPSRRSMPAVIELGDVGVSGLKKSRAFWRCGRVLGVGIWGGGLGRVAVSRPRTKLRAQRCVR
jgi:hypothetical protein